MRCVICKAGAIAEGKATVTLERGSSLIIVKGVPAGICEQCGEYYLSEDVTEKVMARAEEAVARNAELEIIRYAA